MPAVDVGPEAAAKDGMRAIRLPKPRRGLFAASEEAYKVPALLFGDCAGAGASNDCGLAFCIDGMPGTAIIGARVGCCLIPIGVV